MKRTGVARTPLWRGEKLQAKIEAQLSQLLDEARTALGVSLTNAAGRAAYLAGFHAAQAFLSTQSDRVPKTHSGLRS